MKLRFGFFVTASYCNDLCTYNLTFIDFLQCSRFLEDIKKKSMPSSHNNDLGRQN